MLFVFVSSLIGCISQSSKTADTQCLEEYRQILPEEESPLGIQASDYIQLVPKEFQTEVFLADGSSLCLEGTIEIDTESLYYVEAGIDEYSTNYDGPSGQFITPECPNHLTLNALFEFTTPNLELNEIVPIQLELTEDSISEGRLEAEFDVEISNLHGSLMTESAVGLKSIRFSGAIGDSVRGMLSIESSYFEGELILTENNVIAAWNNEYIDWCDQSDM
jgi:hypothetical protein